MKRSPALLNWVLTSEILARFLFHTFTPTISATRLISSGRGSWGICTKAKSINRLYFSAQELFRSDFESGGKFFGLNREKNIRLNFTKANLNTRSAISILGLFRSSMFHGLSPWARELTLKEKLLSIRGILEVPMILTTS